MSFFEKVFNKNTKEEKEEEKNNVENTNEAPVDVAAESEKKENEKNFEKTTEDLAKIEALAMELSGIDPEKAAKNLEKNEELRHKLKVAAGILTTIGFGAALVLSFTERVDVTDLINNFKPMVNEVMMGVAFLGTAISGAMTNFEVQEHSNNIAKAERLAKEAAAENSSVENDSSEKVAA